MLAPGRLSHGWSSWFVNKLSWLVNDLMHDDLMLPHVTLRTDHSPLRVVSARLFIGTESFCCFPRG